MVTRRGLFGRVAAALAIAPAAPKLLADLLPARFDPKKLTLDGNPIEHAEFRARREAWMTGPAPLHEVRFYDDVGELIACPAFCRLNANSYVDKFTLNMLSPRVMIVGHLLPNRFQMSHTSVNLPWVKRDWVDNVSISIHCSTAKVMIDRVIR